jgi:electron transfer flavoprotein alpha/beta subunit
VQSLAVQQAREAPGDQTIQKGRTATSMNETDWHAIEIAARIALLSISFAVMTTMVWF